MPDYTTLVPLLLLLMAIGAFAGVIAGLLGVGGGIVLVPAFFYTFSHLGYGGWQLMQVCIATSLATIIVTSVRSVLAHNRKGAVEWQVLKDWAVFISVGAVCGVVLASQLKSLTLQAIFGVIALVAGMYMAFGKESWRLGAAMPGQPLRGILAVAVGFFSALMGIGGGTFGVPIMSLYGTPIHRAVATASAFGLLIAVPAVIGFMLLDIESPPPYSIGAVNLPAFFVTILMTISTTPWGAKLAHAMDPKPLKRVFAVFITLVALNMLRKVAGW